MEPNESNAEGQPHRQNIPHAVITEEMFSGPLPHPVVLRAYEESTPGISARFVHVWEKEQEHRHAQEKVALTAQLRYRAVGQYLGFASLLFMVSAAVFLIQNGNLFTGGALVVATILSLIRLVKRFFKTSSDNADLPSNC